MAYSHFSVRAPGPSSFRFIQSVKPFKLIGAWLCLALSTSRSMIKSLGMDKVSVAKATCTRDELQGQAYDFRIPPVRAA